VGLMFWGAMMIRARNVVWVLALGSLWGAAELFGRDVFGGIGVGEASVWLTMWAVLVLAIGRGVWHKIGSSFAIALVAAGFKYLGPSIFYCQLLGIVSIGLFFDLFASSLLTRGKTQWWRYALVGILTTYGARAFFILYSVYVARWDRWVEGGVEMALEHVVGSGSVAAAAAALLVPLGFRAGGKLADAVSGGREGDPVAVEHR
jgi:hypothetical protein